MRIDRTSGSSSIGKGSSTKGATKGGPAFTLDTGNAPSRASASAQAGPVAGIDAILALQAVEDPMFAKRKAVKRGQSMLDVLEEMKADLIMGQVSEGRLNRLLALVGQAKMASDPALEALIDDIELRARVELAKLGRYLPD